MRFILTFFLILIYFALASCNPPSTPPPSAIGNPLEYTNLAITYTQQSAEYRALCFQSYNLASYKLQEKLKSYKGKKKPAVVLDIDETILDNSKYIAWCLKRGVGYDKETWKQWTEMAQADTVAGAVAFLKLANKLGVNIIYISNRKVIELQSTIVNMHKFGLPQIDSTNFLLKTDESNKEKRRQLVLKKYEVLLLIGDNLNDFSEIFEGKLRDERYVITNQNQSKFGVDYILLPNVMYGSWESAIYGYETMLTEQQKDSIRAVVLRTY